MSRQPINGHLTDELTTQTGHLTDELTTQTVDAQHDRRDILAQLQDSRSESAAQCPAASLPAPQPAPSSAGRPPA